jgi:hypothetical protein
LQSGICVIEIMHGGYAMRPEVKKALLAEASVLEARGRKMLDDAKRYREFLASVGDGVLADSGVGAAMPVVTTGSSAAGTEGGRESKAARIIRIAQSLIDSSLDPVPSRTITDAARAAGIDLGTNGQNVVASTLSRSPDFEAVGRTGYVRASTVSHENEAPLAPPESASDAGEGATSLNKPSDHDEVLG